MFNNFVSIQIKCALFTLPPQFCDVVEVAIIHKLDIAKFGY